MQGYADDIDTLLVFVGYFVRYYADLGPYQCQISGWFILFHPLRLRRADLPTITTG